MIEYKLSFDNVLKNLLFHFMNKMDKCLYKITEGYRYHYYYIDDIVSNQIHFVSFKQNDQTNMFDHRFIDLDFLLQPFIQVNVYHSYCYMPIDMHYSHLIGLHPPLYLYDVSTNYYAWNQSYFQFIERVESMPPSPPSFVSKIILKTYIVSCDRHVENRECLICLEEKTKFSVCAQCEKEVCIKCMSVMQKKVISKQMNQLCEIGLIHGVLCPFCRHEFPKITKLHIME